MAREASLHGGGEPQVREVTLGRSSHRSCKRDQIKVSDYMNRPVIPPKRVTSPTWGPPPPCKQALGSDDGDGKKKAIGLEQNNNFARASRFFVHFFAVAPRLQHESA